MGVEKLLFEPLEIVVERCVIGILEPHAKKAKITVGWPIKVLKNMVS